MDPRDQPPGAGVEAVHLAVVAAREPERAAVGGHTAHVRAAPAGDPPRVDDLAGRGVHHAHLPGATVRDIETPAVTARVDAVRILRHGDDPHLPEGARGDDPQLAGAHVGDVEDGAVRGEPHVLRHAPSQGHHVSRVTPVVLGVRVEPQRAQDPVAERVDLDEDAGELAADHEEPAVGREVRVVRAATGTRPDVVTAGEGHRVREAHGVVLLDHDDRSLAVGGEVEVVGPGHRDRAGAAYLPGVDRHRLVGDARVHVEPAQVVRRNHVLAQVARADHLDDLVGALVDHRDPAAQRVGHVEQRPLVPHARAEHALAGLGVDISTDDRRHARQRVAELPRHRRLRPGRGAPARRGRRAPGGSGTRGGAAAPEQQDQEQPRRCSEPPTRTHARPLRSRAMCVPGGA